MVQVSADGAAMEEFVARYQPNDVAEINEWLHAFLPEVRDSQFGDYPMKQQTWMWLNTTTTCDNDASGGGNPAFLPSPVGQKIKYREDANYNSKVPMKRDYVFGTGPKGFGYYHLLTRQAWVILNSRIVVMKSTKSGYKSWTKGKPEDILSGADKVTLDKLGKLLYRRSHSSEGPNEVPKNTFYGAKREISGEMC